MTVDQFRVASTLFIGNLDYNANDEDVARLLDGFDVVHSFALLSQGCALAEFRSPEEARRARNDLNGRSFQGRSIRVKQAKGSLTGGRSTSGTWILSDHIRWIEQQIAA